MADTPTNARADHVLADPTAAAVARMYAGSFLDAAAATGEPAPLDEFTSFIDDVLKPNPEFEHILTSEWVRRDEKLALIDRAIAPHASPLFTNFLRVLARHDRLELLPLILDEAWRESERRGGKQRVIVRSARPLSQQQQADIRSRLDAALPFEPVLIPEVDESLIGGLVIQVGDTVYDSSLKTQLRNLQSRLRERYQNEIQSGRDRFGHPEGN